LWLWDRTTRTRRLSGVVFRCGGWWRKIRRNDFQKTPSKLPSPVPPCTILAQRRWHRAAIYLASHFQPTGHTIAGPPSSSNRTYHRGLTMAGRPPSLRATTLCCGASIGSQSPACCCDARRRCLWLEVSQSVQAIADRWGVVLQNTAYSVNSQSARISRWPVFDELQGPLFRSLPCAASFRCTLGSMDLARLSNNLSRETRAASARRRLCHQGSLSRRHASTTSRSHRLVYDMVRTQHPVLVATAATMPDIGGISPGSMSPNATTIDRRHL